MKRNFKNLSLIVLSGLLAIGGVNFTYANELSKNIVFTNVEEKEKTNKVEDENDNLDSEDIENVSYNEINVKTFDELENVIKDTKYSNIKISDNLEFENTLTIERDVNIYSDNKEIKTKGEFRHFYIGEDSKVKLDNLKFISNSDEDINDVFGGIDIDDNTEVEINNCVFKGNSSYRGGAIENNGKLIISDSIFNKNIASEGGAIFNDGALLIKGETLFENNKALSNGGAIANEKKLELYGKLDFNKNIANDIGGAISNLLGLRRKSNNIKLNDDIIIDVIGEVNFKENMARDGGAIGGESYNSCKNIINIYENSEVIFKKNEASYSYDDEVEYGEGGAIFNNELNIMDNSYVEFLENKAGTGGAISNKDYLEYSYDLTNIQNNINIDSNRGVLFKDNLIIGDYENQFDGLDITTSFYNDINIKNGTFINSNKEKSNIYIQLEDIGYLNKNKLSKSNNSRDFGEIKLGKVNISNSFIDSKKNFIRLGKYLYDQIEDNYNKYIISIDKSRFENLNSIFSEKEKNIEEYKYIDEKHNRNPISLIIKNSTINSENLEIINHFNKSELEMNSVLEFFNNTINTNKLSLNGFNEKFMFNTIISKEIHDVDTNIFMNNIIVSNKSNELKKILGKSEKIQDSKDKILFKNEVDFSTENKMDITYNIFRLISGNIDYEISEKMKIYYFALIFTDEELENIEARMSEESEKTMIEKALSLKEKGNEKLWEELEVIIQSLEEQIKEDLNEYNIKIQNLEHLKKNIENIYISLDNKIDLQKTLENKKFEYIKVGSFKDSKNLEHYMPVKNSYAIGFSKIEGIDKDAIDKERKYTTMGSIESYKLEPTKPQKPETDKPKKNKRKKKESDNVLQKVEKHYAYLFGYEDNTIRPEGNITREEATAILDRITPDKPMTKMMFRYLDVDENRWSYMNINNLSNKGGIKGYPNSKFLPENKITRAEAATILVRLENIDIVDKQNLPKELEGHWAAKDLIIAIDKGWLKGYEDGSLKPDKEITRAEFVTLVNRILNRKVKKENILLGIREFKDLDEQSWYYENIVEATNSHSYKEKRLEDGSEKWIDIFR